MKDEKPPKISSNKTLNFTVLGIPATQGSMRIYMTKGRPRMKSDSSKTMPFRQEVGWTALRARADAGYNDIMYGRHVPVAISIVFYLPAPQTMPAGRFVPSVKPDVDKAVRLVFDALSGVIWVDDGQVVELHAYKRYDDPPRVSIKIEEVSE